MTQQSGLVALAPLHQRGNPSEKRRKNRFVWASVWATHNVKNMQSLTGGGHLREVRPQGVYILTHSLWLFQSLNAH